MRVAPAVALCIVVSACASSPKTWVPSRYATPPGVAHSLWEACWQVQEERAAKESSYRRMTPKQRQCLVMRLAESCVYDALKRLRVDRPTVAARCDVATFQDFMLEASYEYCGDDEGGGGEVMALYTYLANRERGSGGALNRSAMPNACPAQ